jgi:hypothetical protein
MEGEKGLERTGQALVYIIDHGQSSAYLRRRTPGPP